MEDLIDLPLHQKISVLRNTSINTQYPNGITQSKLSDELGVTRNLIAAWETGRSKPTSIQIEQMARFFNISYEQLQDSETLIHERYPFLEDMAKDIIVVGEKIWDELTIELWGEGSSLIAKEVKKYSRQKISSSEPHFLDEQLNIKFRSLVKTEIHKYFSDTGIIWFSEELIPSGQSRAGSNDNRNYFEILTVNDDLKELEISEYVIVDPLDRTVEAVRGLAGFANISVGSFKYGPLVSVVFSFFENNISCFYAIKNNGAFVRYRDKSEQSIKPSKVKELANSCLSAYIGKSSRSKNLNQFKNLFDHYGHENPFINQSGCYGFCLVASSIVDGFIELTKGYAWHDIVSGAHILKEAGGIIRRVNFRELDDPFNYKNSGIEQVRTLEDAFTLLSALRENRTNNSENWRRFKFIAASTYDLVGQIVAEISKDYLLIQLNEETEK